MNTHFKDLKKKNILFIVHNYHSFQKDQIESVSQYFNKVYVLVRYKPISEYANILGISEAKNHIKKAIIDLKNKPKNIEVIPIPLWYLQLDWWYKKLGKQEYLLVTKIIHDRKIKFDLIHAHFTWTSGYVGAKLKEAFKVPLVITAHGEDIYDLPFRDSVWKSLVVNTCNQANVLTTVSKSNQKCIKKLAIKTPLALIPNGFQKKLFYPKNGIQSRLDLNLPKDKTIILSIGSMDAVKGHQYLISTIKLLVKIQPNILCLIVGEGPLKNQLQRQINKDKLAKIISLVPRQPHHELFKWFNACDLYVLPSISESFGVTQLEAMACGKPVVATKNGGSEEIITEGINGFLCKSKNPLAMSKAINKALKIEWSKKKISQSINRYLYSKQSVKFLSIYSKLLK